MKIIQHISFLILVSVFFIQCKKNREPEPVTFSGTITDNVLGTPVANATIKIGLQQSATNSVFNTGYVTVETVTTDANGYYSVTFEPENPIAYKISVEKDIYFSREVEVSADIASAGTNTINNFGIDPYGWFKINIKNITPNDAADNIIYQNTSENSGCSSCCNNLPISLNGMTIDTFFICKRTAHPNITFSWFVTKDGVMVPHTGSTTAIIGDTVEYNLNY